MVFVCETFAFVASVGQGTAATIATATEGSANCAEEEEDAGDCEGVSVPWRGAGWWEV